MQHVVVVRTERDVDVVTGMFMLVRREAITQVGLMDEAYFVYSEEADWCYRVSQAGWRRVCTLEQIPDGEVWPAELEGRSLLLSRSGAQVSCFDNACAHLGMPLDDGSVHAGVLTCPHHGFRFSLESGECLTVPEVQLVTHAVRVTHGVVEVRLT